MSELYKVEEYKEIDSGITIIMDLYKQPIDNTKLVGGLIYYSSNYISFLEAIINDSTVDTIIVLKKQNYIIGLIHFKLKNEHLFLNCIALVKEVQGKGLGRYFLKESLDIIKTDQIKYLSLDVFGSNSLAFSWYKSLGFLEMNLSEWIEITPRITESKFEKYSITYDENGFESCYIQDEKVATIVNGTMIIHTFKYLNLINISDYKFITNVEIPSIISGDYNIKYLDKSIRMQNELCDVMIRLNSRLW